jgi:hypothetical protein
LRTSSLSARLHYLCIWIELPHGAARSVFVEK